MEEVDLMTVINTVNQIPNVNYSQYDDLLDYPHLFESINDDLSTPGIPLPDALTCQVTWNRNQFPTLQLTYPRDGKNMGKIAKNKYIMADINRKFIHQLFKITHVQKELDNIIVDANHIAASLNDSTVPNTIQFNDGSAMDLMNQVLNTMEPSRDIEFDSNVSTISNINVEGGQQAGAILINPDQEGDTAVQSLLGLFGGELEFNNSEIRHSTHAGQETGIVIDYGKNIQSISQDTNIENTYTGAVFVATYTPGQAIATEDNTDWHNWQSEYSNVGTTYLAGGSINIYDSPVEGQKIVRTLTNGQKISLGKAVADGSFTPDGKFQINTVNGDSWYPIAPSDGGGWIDAAWLNFDSTGSYLINKVTGDVTVKASDPHDESGAGTRVSISGYAIVSYKKGGSINVYYSPEIGPDHYRTGKTKKNGARIFYDMVERNQNGDLWYRIGDHQWLYGPHLSLSQDGSYQSHPGGHGYGYVKNKAPKYYLNKNHQMVVTTKTVDVRSSKTKHKGRDGHWTYKQKTVKVPAKKGMSTIDRVIHQGGATYYHTRGGWVKSSSIDFKVDGSVKPPTADQFLKSQIKDHSKVEIYKTPDKTQALNWSIPNGTKLTVLGEEAKGGDGITYVKVSYKGQTGWLPESNIDDKNSNIHAEDADKSSDSDENKDVAANVDQSQKEVRVVVGPLYADGFGLDPNVDKVNTVDISSNFKHDDQDLSGQQADGSFVATQADIEQATQIGYSYLKEHKYGQFPVSLTITYQEMSGLNADVTQLSMYDYLYVNFVPYDIKQTAEINAQVWDCLAHHYLSLTIGELPETYEHLLLQAADKKSGERTSRVAERVSHNSGLLNRYDRLLKLEGSSRKQAEKQLMDDLGLIQHRVDKNGKDIAVQLVTNKNFENQMNKIQAEAQDLKNWVTSGGSGVIQAIPNWQNPIELTATSENGGRMAFTGNGLVFYDEYGNERPRTGMDSQGRVYADSIIAGTIKAVTINSCLIDSALTIGKENGMNIYVGTSNPDSTNGLNPDNGGNVIWVRSPNYEAMVSSGQLAVKSYSSDSVARIRPRSITVGEENNEVLTQENFAQHAYYTLKTWVEGWVADYITVKGTQHTIWKGKDYDHASQYLP